MEQESIQEIIEYYFSPTISPKTQTKPPLYMMSENSSLQSISNPDLMTPSEYNKSKVNEYIETIDLAMIKLNQKWDIDIKTHPLMMKNKDIEKKQVVWDETNPFNDHDMNSEEDDMVLGMILQNEKDTVNNFEGEETGDKSNQVPNVKKQRMKLFQTIKSLIKS